jgi:hypothetical protein
MAVTKTKRKTRKKRVVKAEQVEEPQQEVVEVGQDGQVEQMEEYAALEIIRLGLDGSTYSEEVTPQATIIDTVYIANQGKLDGYFGDDAADLIKQIQSGDDSEYKLYQPNGKPFYMAIQNETLKPLTFPEPKDYGTTSANLFAMAVTCADAIAEFIRLKIRGKQGLATQLMRPGVLGMALVVAIFLIFILSVYIGGSG